ncbi:type II CRISPR-associated endonuclease Cas1 [Treponema pectinovorum]|uniref:type II CRISPR-associated endonuclease Cas1 n=1 Tax=Treponema pectinovorum TaxID=164 RepID=UPI0011C95916|nr:type II CRISPR-associated endonuclease Cas1 [Treponema pectinovorum]
MLNRVLEINDENRYLSLNRGFIVVKEKDKELGSVPLDDIAVMIISAQSAIFTKNVINALAEHGGITILCGKNYIPESYILPFADHYLFTKNLKNQIAASVPFKKRIWQQVIIKKIQNQAQALIFCGKIEEAQKIKKISFLVKSGDCDNREAHAAKNYWKYLFGKNFTRDRFQSGINAFLNYGYAVMRAAMCRAICSNGLLPSLGIYHENNLNQFCLADDLFEIYRPIIDCLVYKLNEKGEKELTPEIKKLFANTLKIKVHTSEGDSQACQSMQYLVASYVHALEEGKPVIELPEWENNLNGITIIE